MARKVTLKEIYQMGRDSYDSLWSTAKRYGRDVKLYLHWSSGHYNSIFDDYHINITGDGTLYCTGDLDECKAHTWRRNRGSVGISLCCAYKATSNNIGPEPPTEIQINQMARVIAVLANALDLTIDKYRVLTHGEAADNYDEYTGAYESNEVYGPVYGDCERWDLQYLGTDESPKFLKSYTDPATGGNVLRGKANWYRNRWKEHPEERPY